MQIKKIYRVENTGCQHKKIKIEKHIALEPVTKLTLLTVMVGNPGLLVLQGVLTKEECQHPSAGKERPCLSIIHNIDQMHCCKDIKMIARDSSNTCKLKAQRSSHINYAGCFIASSYEGGETVPPAV